MPRIFKIGSYWIYFWSNEGRPLEPVHVHVTEGKPTANATKIWLTREGKCILEHNNSNIKENHLKNILRVIENQKKMVFKRWEEFFGELVFIDEQ